MPHKDSRNDHVSNHLGREPNNNGLLEVTEIDKVRCFTNFIGGKNGGH